MFVRGRTVLFERALERFFFHRNAMAMMYKRVPHILSRPIFFLGIVCLELPVSSNLSIAFYTLTNFYIFCLKWVISRLPCHIFNKMRLSLVVQSFMRTVS
jgi:hypothetical protein